ncbi:N-acetyltransferase [Mucilaginibacter sp.]|uniref:N-acetyltransferase n=1 Tax=Mucilaginibacter sp. TaxID=1882438 RepID=UPI002ED16F1D
MATKIVTKFIIGNEQGINDLLVITTAIAGERFKGKVPDQELENYIDANFSKDALMVELNSMSNQYLMVYADDEPAGYVRVTTKGTRPEFFAKKTLARIADFGVLARYSDPLINKSLFEKSLSVSTMQQVVWISEFEGSPYLDLFESYGFKRNTDISVPQALSIQPVYFVKEKA